MEAVLGVLQKYWGYSQFREGQLPVIENILSGEDTLAIMPTGGGKSICFQVPAMAMEGICIVVSPLVALIKDQVSGLKQKGIKATAITGGMPFHELDSELDNCIYGNYKFLYLSPERLQQEIVTERIKQMPVNLIAIDEAHCISQWGNDFRPAYRNCGVLKELFPDKPLLALTASATKKVTEDVLENLSISKENLFKTSVARKNLAYMVFDETDKRFKIELMLKKNPGSSIIYVRNRKATVTMAAELLQNGISADFFHGGLTSAEKESKLNQWLQNQTQVMVATNAFGMGINKPDVRTVIHSNLPDSLESYFQEAGRAGRDGEKAFAVILKNSGDQEVLKNQFLSMQPSVDTVKLVYKKLNSYFQIAYGEGEGESFPFNFNHFCNTYGINPVLGYNCLKLLDNHSVLSLSENFQQKIKVLFTCSNHQLFLYLDRNPKSESVLQAVLRTYGGVFETETTINSSLIASKTGTTEAEVVKTLQQAGKEGIVQLKEMNTDAEITFLVPREDDKTISNLSKYIKLHQSIKEGQIHAVLNYVNNHKTCKSRQLLAYFGEEVDHDCGICSVCIEKKHKSSAIVLEIVADEILKTLEAKPMSSKELVKTLTFREEPILTALTTLVEHQKITINSKNQYELATA